MVNMTLEIESTDQELSNKYYLSSVGPLLRIYHTAQSIRILRGKTKIMCPITVSGIMITIYITYDARNGICT